MLSLISIQLSHVTLYIGMLQSNLKCVIAFISIVIYFDKKPQSNDTQMLLSTFSRSKELDSIPGENVGMKNCLTHKNRNKYIFLIENF